MDGERVMVEWNGGATGRGEFADRPPNGRRYRSGGREHFHVVDGQYRFQRGFWDRVGSFLQLGMPVKMSWGRHRCRQ